MVVYGKQVTLYLLENHPEMIRTLYLSKEIDTGLFRRFQKAVPEILRVDAKKAQGMARGGNHQGFLAEITSPEEASADILKSMKLVVVTVGVTDVGNLGAIARTAFALGAEAMIAAGAKTFPWGGAVRTSSGALLDLPLIVEPNALDALNHLKMAGFACFGATLEGEDRRDFSGVAKRALILGSEHEGLSGKVRKKLDGEITIPMAQGFDSLNVGAAAAILMDRMRG